MTLSGSVRHILRELAWKSDFIYRPIGALRSRRPFGPEDTDLFCSGYPRSGNHFCAYGLKLLCVNKCRTNKPSHIPPLVERSIKIAKPTVIVLRRPEDAVVSWSIYTGEKLWDCFRYYEQYHRLVKPFVNRCVVAEFGDFITDLRPVARSVSARFGLSFDLNDYNHDVLSERIFKEIEDKEKKLRDGGLDLNQLPAPSRHRDDNKWRLKEKLEEEKYKPLLEKCRVLYEGFCEYSVSQQSG